MLHVKPPANFRLGGHPLVVDIVRVDQVSVPRPQPTFRSLRYSSRDLHVPRVVLAVIRHYARRFRHEIRQKHLRLDGLVFFFIEYIDRHRQVESGLLDTCRRHYNRRDVNCIFLGIRWMQRDTLAHHRARDAHRGFKATPRFGVCGFGPHGSGPHQKHF